MNIGKRGMAYDANYKMPKSAKVTPGILCMYTP